MGRSRQNSNSRFQTPVNVVTLTSYIGKLKIWYQVYILMQNVIVIKCSGIQSRVMKKSSFDLCQSKIAR